MGGQAQEGEHQPAALTKENSVVERGWEQVPEEDEHGAVRARDDVAPKKGQQGAPGRHGVRKVV